MTFPIFYETITPCYLPKFLISGASLMSEVITWSLTCTSILGAVLNVKKRRSGFIAYTVANVGWVAVDIYYGVYAQAALFIVFTGLSVWGLITWKDKPW